MLSPTLPSWCSESNGRNNTHSPLPGERGDRSRALPARMLSPTLPPMFDQDFKHGTKLREGKNSRQGSRSTSRQSSPAVSDIESMPRKREAAPTSTLKVEERKEKKPLKVVKKENRDKTTPEPTKKRQASTVLGEPIKRARNRSYSSSEELDTPKRPKAKQPMRTKLGAMLSANPPDPVSSSDQKTRKEPSFSRMPVNAPTPVSSSKPKLSQEQRESHNQLLMLKMSKWADLARQQKHESDKYAKTRPLQAGVIAMDALLAYIVAFDYEDRAHQVMRRPKRTRSWSTLVPYIGWLINLLEEGDCRHLIGLCYQIRALIQLRMGSCYKEQINRIIEEADPQKFEELSDTAAKLVKCNDSSVLDFKRGVRDLGIEKIETMFPKAWKRRALFVQPVSKHEGGYRPLEDPYYLPLHSFSTLQEAAALGCAITKEWAENNDIEIDWTLVRGLER